MSDVAKLKITMDSSGGGTVVLDGHDITHCVSSVAFSARAGNPNEVSLTICAEVSAEVDAVLEKISVAKAGAVQENEVRLLSGQILKVRPRPARG